MKKYSPKSHAALIADLNNLGKNDNIKGKDFVKDVFNKITGTNDGFKTLSRDIISYLRSLCFAWSWRKGEMPSNNLVQYGLRYGLVKLLNSVKTDFNKIAKTSIPQA